MAIRVSLNHSTHYSFDRAVKISPHVIRLRPAVHSRTPIHAYSLKIEPAEHFINWQQDAFGNFLARVVFPNPSDKLFIDVELIAELTVINPFDFFLEDYAEKFPFKYEESAARELAAFLQPVESGPLLMKFVERIDLKPKRTVDFLVSVNSLINTAIHYELRLEPGVQTCEESLGLQSGSCRDSAYLLVQIFRHLGLAARFVSGYLVQLTSDEKPLDDGPAGPAEDFTDLHAWTEVYIPGAGWIGLDPTSGLFAGEGHIPLACTPEPASAAPIVGATDKCEVSFDFKNAVTRIHEDPRVTKPYTDSQWNAARALGGVIDRELAEGDVRLTMGGEPTFISMDDMGAPEWNTTADSPAKRALASLFLLEIEKEFSHQGVRQYGEGKWYPGEPLPRWSYLLYWRKDGKQLWSDAKRLADPNKPRRYTTPDARALCTAISEEMRVAPEHVIAGYENHFYYAWKETEIPPIQGEPDDPELRYLAALQKRGIERPSGYALPLFWHPFEGWSSGQWTFRGGKMLLMPGSSAIGFRLPLGQLPNATAEETLLSSSERPPGIAPPCLDESVEQLTRATRQSSSRFTARTALCVECREGHLYVFLPPAITLEGFIILIRAVERAAKRLDKAIVIEGYPAPWDQRIERIAVTPDPGVIEVNIHPSKNWEELVERTEKLHAAAKRSRLATEKYMLDGRHTGTGGGNHVTLGGVTPADSPFLRKPALLRSLITYWQHHPGLSYLFSGMFIGPTSQAPRVDEGRDEKLYELEIAFDHLPNETDQPWIVDRVLRHLLTDLTGNTHRSEFCIDKLYSPDSQSGRLGIVEFRAFEMPPHPRMALVQTLLLRALVAWFWKEPYHHKLARWGTELHDRFMLPHYVHSDLRDVVADLNAAGYPFKLDWLDPFFEFRFPVYGRVTHGDMEIELRFAIEPWHVLGEESSSQGTARYVDSSVERLQVRVRGMTDSRHIVTCNGRRLPLSATGVRGEFVTGVRFKAWAPPSALHPLIGVQTPLVFDIMDTWNGRSIGGCVYHVSHPGGLSYETIPVNANEAESRRISRYWQHGHTPAPIQIVPNVPLGEKPPLDTDSIAGHRTDIPPIEELNKDYPVTLDLRHSSALKTSRINP